MAANPLLDTVSGFFADNDTLPWTDDLAVEACERDLEDPGQEAAQDENLRNLAWALVHSRRESHVLRGIATLHVQLSSTTRQPRRRELLYLLAVGYFRTQDLAQSRNAVNKALRVSPEFNQAERLKKMVEHKITTDGILGAGLVVAATLSAGAAIAMGVTACAAAWRRRF